MAQSCDRIVAALRAAGVVVDIVHFTRRDTHLRIETGYNGRYFAISPGPDLAHTLNILWNMLEAQHATTPWTHVVAFGGQIALLAAPVYAAWLGVPLITLIRGNDFDVGIFSTRQRTILNEALERAARVGVVSQDKARKIRALYPHIHPVWIPNGIDLEAWTLLDTDRRRAVAWRDQHVAPGCRVLGMFGQLKPKKGGLFFLRTLLASGHSKRFHLLLVGEIGSELDAWLQNHTDQIACTCSPFVDRYALLAYYAACDLVVVASFYDGLPNVVLESAALGIPLIASCTGGMADVLVDGEHGYLFAPGDQHDCRRAITQAASLTDAELQCFGQACRTLVHTHLSHEIEAERYIQVLLETRQEERA